MAQRSDVVDPSSTMMSSKSRNVCRQTLEIARRNSSGLLYVGNRIYRRQQYKQIEQTTRTLLHLLAQQRQMEQQIK